MCNVMQHQRPAVQKPVERLKMTTTDNRHAKLEFVEFAGTIECALVLRRNRLDVAYITWVERPCEYNGTHVVICDIHVEPSYKPECSGAALVGIVVSLCEQRGWGCESYVAEGDEQAEKQDLLRAAGLRLFTAYQAADGTAVLGFRR